MAAFAFAEIAANRASSRQEHVDEVFHQAGLPLHGLRRRRVPAPLLDVGVQERTELRARVDPETAAEVLLCGPPDLQGVPPDQQFAALPLDLVAVVVRAARRKRLVQGRRGTSEVLAGFPFARFGELRLGGREDRLHGKIARSHNGRRDERHAELQQQTAAGGVDGPVPEPELDIRDRDDVPMAQHPLRLLQRHAVDRRAVAAPQVLNPARVVLLVLDFGMALRDKDTRTENPVRNGRADGQDGRRDVAERPRLLAVQPFKPVVREDPRRIPLVDPLDGQAALPEADGHPRLQPPFGHLPPQHEQAVAAAQVADPRMPVPHRDFRMRLAHRRFLGGHLPGAPRLAADHKRKLEVFKASLMHDLVVALKADHQGMVLQACRTGHITTPPSSAAHYAGRRATRRPSARFQARAGTRPCPGRGSPGTRRP